MAIHILGPVVGAATFVVIGLFHPLVIKAEYHIGKKIWPLFLVCGLILTFVSMLIANPYLSVIIAVVAFTCFWTIVELYEQEKRVEKGWHPKNPKRCKTDEATHNYTIVLASASPRRRDILNTHGIDPIIIPSNADETIPDAEIEHARVDEIAIRIAHLKASEVYERLRTLSGNYTSRVIVLGADTVIDKDGIIGKPTDADDAFRILSKLRNTTHRVITGVSLIDLASGEQRSFADITEVTFKDYPDEEILRFVREEQPFDKSGAYAIQSSWSKNVANVKGDIENVVGLPWARIKKELA
jgi:septum formation protein